VVSKSVSLMLVVSAVIVEPSGMGGHCGHSISFRHEYIYLLLFPTLLEFGIMGTQCKEIMIM
jgi:hypothetical protein